MSARNQDVIGGSPYEESNRWTCVISWIRAGCVEVFYGSVSYYYYHSALNKILSVLPKLVTRKIKMVLVVVQAADGVAVETKSTRTH